MKASGREDLHVEKDDGNTDRGDCEDPNKWADEFQLSIDMC